MKPTKTEIQLDAKQRIQTIEIPQGATTMIISVSRDNCKDILLEIVDSNGNATGKPLTKYIPSCKLNKSKKLRFSMNNFSTKPITIELMLK